MVGTALLLAAACSSRSINEGASGAGGSSGGSAGAAASGGSGAGGSSGGSGGSEPDAAAKEVTVTASIANNADGAMWEWSDSAAAWSEKFQFKTYAYLVISDIDPLKQSVGLRFSLDVPQGAEIVSATLLTYIVPTGSANKFELGDTLQVRAYTTDVPFDKDHAHSPDQHGTLTSAVEGYVLDKASGGVTSPNLATLVEQRTGASDWHAGDFIIFHLGPQSMSGRQVLLGDKESTLQVTYVAP